MSQINMENLLDQSFNDALLSSVEVLNNGSIRWYNDIADTVITSPSYYPIAIHGDNFGLSSEEIRQKVNKACYDFWFNQP